MSTSLFPSIFIYVREDDYKRLSILIMPAHNSQQAAETSFPKEDKRLNPFKVTN